MGAGRVMTLKGFAVLLAISLLAFAAVACNGNGDETSQADGTPVVGDGDGDGGNGEGLSDLESLAAAAGGGVIAKVTYGITTEGSGGTIKGEWVLVRRPPDSRIEISGTEGGVEIRTIVISAGGKSYICIAGRGEESCLEAEEEEAGAAAALLDPLFDIPSEIAEGVEGVNLGDASQRTIAGVNATCFTVSGTLASLSEGEVCFSDEGLLLYVQSEVDGSSSTFEATSVSTDVTDADFEPPYDVLTLPDFGFPD